MCEWVWVGVRLIIEYPSVAHPNIKRALICASVATRKVCGPIGRARRIGRYSRYIYSVYAAGRTIGKRTNTNSSLLDSTYCGCLIIKLYVLMYCGVIVTLKSNRAATRIAVIPGINGVKYLMRP